MKLILLISALFNPPTFNEDRYWQNTYCDVKLADKLYHRGVAIERARRANGLQP